MRELIAVVARGDVDYLADQLDDAHVIGIGFGGVPNLVDDELDCCVDKKYREQVEDIGPCRDDRSTQKDKHQAACQGNNDADEQYLLLVLARDLEGAHDKRENKEVIYG